MVEFAEMGTVTKSTVIVATNKRVNDHKSAGKTLKLPNRDKEKNKKKS